MSGLASVWKATAALKRANAAGDEALRLREVGRQHEALAAEEVALAGYRELSKERPRVLVLVASTLQHRYRALRELGRHEEALAAIAESVAIRRGVEGAPPQTLARALNEHARALSELGQSEMALVVSEEAFELASQHRSVLELAEALVHKAHALQHLGRSEEALVAIELWRSIDSPRIRGRLDRLSGASE